jgi:bifunctional non-homologous end joining protein LigD
MTAEYRVARRPKGRVLVDYNQNAWGRTLASVYSVRPTPRATVSTPLTWDELAGGASIDDFRHRQRPCPRRRDRTNLWNFRPLARGRTRMGLCAITVVPC